MRRNPRRQHDTFSASWLHITQLPATGSDGGYKFAAKGFKVAQPVLDDRPHDRGIEPAVFVHGDVAEADHPPHAIRHRRRQN